MFLACVYLILSVFDLQYTIVHDAHVQVEDFEQEASFVPQRQLYGWRLMVLQLI